jgi:bifunctional non-homologous end joining protein LigD
MDQQPSRWAGKIEGRLAGGCCSKTRQEKSRSQRPKKKQRSKQLDVTSEKQAKESKQEVIASSVTKPPAVSPKVKIRARLLDADECAGAPEKRPMPTAIYPMLAESVTEPFDGAQWLFEIKWDGYRAIAFLENGKVRLVSRNQNDLTGRYPELKDMAKTMKAKTAILDGEVVALDSEGKASFSLMQQRTGFRPGGHRASADANVTVLYYAFDLLYLDGYDWRRVPLEERKRKLASTLVSSDGVRYSDHYEEHGKALFEIARDNGLEGIVAKVRNSCYVERRSGEWLKIKIRRRLEAVVGGYTETKGSRTHFGSLVLGLYDEQGRLIHVGQAGSGFNQESLGEISKVLKKLETDKNPFFGDVDALRKVSFVKPELVAEIEFAEWTGGTNTGSGPKLRAPVFLGLRDDKNPKECRLDQTGTN